MYTVDIQTVQKPVPSAWQQMHGPANGQRAGGGTFSGCKSTGSIWEKIVGGCWRLQWKLLEISGGGEQGGEGGCRLRWRWLGVGVCSQVTG
mmetsp:Transcript_67857/g.113992  ORF Transcript_67857/g.113992 Transcript_67857/m.113992 type:complete len:91 (+) Transcript_67857:396-668(+)